MKTEITDTLAACLNSVIFAIHSGHKGRCGDHIISEVQFSEAELEILKSAVKAYYDARRETFVVDHEQTKLT